MIDGTTEPDKSGKPVWHERSAQDIDHIRRLVQTAVGFDAKRGDTVEIVSMRFAEAPGEAQAAPPALFGLALEKTDLISLAQSSIMGVVVLLALLFILRPMAMRLTGLGETMSGQEPPLLAGAAGGAMRALAGPGSTPALAGPGGTPLLADESMIEMANIEGQIRASSIRKLAELVEKHPDQTLSIMRGWMAEGRA